VPFLMLFTIFSFSLLVFYKKYTISIKIIVI